MEDAAFISNLVSVLIDQPDRELRDLEDVDHFELLQFPDIIMPRDRAFSWDVSLENDVSGELMAQQALDAYAKETADPKQSTNKKNLIVVKPENHVNLLNNYQANSSSKDSKSASTGDSIQVKIEGTNNAFNHTIGIAANSSFTEGGDDLFDQVDHILEPFLQDSANQPFSNVASGNTVGMAGTEGNQNPATHNATPHLSLSSSSYTSSSNKDHRSMGGSLSINGHVVKPKVTIKLDSKPISSSKGPDIKKTNEILKGFDHSTSIYLRHDFDSNSNSAKRTNSSGNNSSTGVNSSTTLTIPTMTSDIKRSPHMNLSMLQQQQQQLQQQQSQSALLNNSNGSNSNLSNSSLSSMTSNNAVGINSMMNGVSSGLNAGNTGNSSSLNNGSNSMSNNNLTGLNVNGGNSSNLNLNLSSGIQSIHKVSSTGSINNAMNGLSTDYSYNTGNNSGKLTSSNMNPLRQQSPYIVSNTSAGNNNTNNNNKDADLMARMMNNAYSYADILSMQQGQPSSGNSGALGLNGTLTSGLSSPNMVHHHQQQQAQLHLQQQQQQHHQHRYSPNLGMEMSPYMMNSNMGMNMSQGGLERRVGAYTIEERRIKIEKFRERKRQRIWRKQIKYDCRKRLADTRPRVKGRFVSRKNLGNNNSLDGQDGQMSPDGKDYQMIEMGEGSDDDNSMGGLQHHANLQHHQSGLNVNIHGSSMAMGGMNNAGNMNHMNGMNLNGGINAAMNSGVMSGPSPSGLNSLINSSHMQSLGHGSGGNSGSLGQGQNQSHSHNLNLLHSNSNHVLHHQSHQQTLHQTHLNHNINNNSNGSNNMSSSSDLIGEIPFPPDLPSMVSTGALGPPPSQNNGSMQQQSSSMVANSMPNSLNS